MQHYLCLLGLALPTIVNGFALFDRSPVDLDARRQPAGCTKNVLVNLVASIQANQPGGGVSFCLSELGISTQTITLTDTTSTSTTSTVLTTHRGTVTVNPTTITSTVTQTTRTAECEPHPIARRNERLEQRAAQSLIISACLCIAPATPSTTTTTSVIRTITTKTTTTVPITRTVTPTIRSTTTTTITRDTCPLPTTCNNQGLQYAYYGGPSPPYPFNTGNYDSDYSIYQPDLLRALTPGPTGVTNYINIPANIGDAPVSIYTFTGLFPVEQFSLEHRGYIYAGISGRYTFTATNVDDIVLFWITISGVGSAYSGWNRGNANAVAAYDNSGDVNNGPGSTTYSFTLVEGLYYPIRIIYGQATGAASANVQITDPNGNVILGPSSTATPYIVQYSCDNRAAPKFKSFTKET